MNKVKGNAYEEEIEMYFNDIKDIPPLTREEEQTLGRKIQKGNQNALNKLVERNLKFVVKIAKQYRNRGILFSDVVSEGNLGLIHAAKMFNPEKNIKFISYAVWWIRYYIEKALDECKSVKDYESSLDDYTYVREVDDIGGINKKFEEELNGLSDRRNVVEEILACLKEREKKVILMSFGLFGEKEMTLDEISKATNLSMERVRQIKDNALVKIKCEVLSRPNSEISEFKELF